MNQATNHNFNILPRWLKLKPAAYYSAIGEKRLKKLADKGVIIGFCDPDSGRKDWIFDRISIDKYRERQSKKDNLQIKKTALEILKSVNV